MVEGDTLLLLDLEIMDGSTLSEVKLVEEDWFCREYI
jgi:hypothetical protein